MKKSDYDKLNIASASYIGKPVNNTVMFIAKKVEYLLDNLKTVEQCLVFCEDSIIIPTDLAKKHIFIKSVNPQLEYARYVENLAFDIEQKNKKRKYTFTEGGYYMGENVTIGDNVVIEPLCFIDHDVVIGRNARIFSGTKIRNAVIGDNFIANENSIIGSQGFVMAKDEKGNRKRIPTLGKVIIGNNVEVGTLSNICVGTAGYTVIEDYVKIDSLVYIGHDTTLKSNVELPAGVIVGGYNILESNVFIGFNATLRNRIIIEKNSVVGMGSVATKSIPANTTVVGNPAKPFEKK